MGRSPCCSKVGLRRGPWSAKEDALLANYIQQHGEGQWRSLPKKAGLLRCGKSCRLRWMNYLRPGIKRGNISQDEEDLIVRLHTLLGNRWSLIAGRLPGRTDNEIKNYWNTHLLKKLKKPTTTAAAAAAAPTKKKKANVKLLGGGAANDDGQIIINKTKVYLPKPIRVSPVLPRTSSYESLASTGTSTTGDAAEKVVPVEWPPLFELEDAFLQGHGCIPPLLHHHHHYHSSDSISGDVNMWEKVYDEYLQLL